MTDILKIYYFFSFTGFLPCFSKVEFIPPRGGELSAEIFTVVYIEMFATSLESVAKRGILLWIKPLPGKKASISRRKNENYFD